MKQCEDFNCERADDLHFAYGYGWAGLFCAEHCPNRECNEGCDHHEEHERELEERQDYDNTVFVVGI